MEKVCKNCKHWMTYNHECYAADIYEYMKMPERDNFGVFAEALDDSGLDARLLTGPEFGCNHFTPRD